MRGGATLYNSLFPIPSAGPQPLLKMRRRGRHGANRVLVSGNRNHDLAGMQMQARLAEARSISIDIVADNRPAHRGCVNPQLMGAAGHWFQREPGELSCSLPPCGGGLERGADNRSLSLWHPHPRPLRASFARLDPAWGGW